MNNMKHILIFFILILPLCNSRHAFSNTSSNSTQELSEQLNKLYKKYLNGTISDARESLHESISTLEKSKLEKPSALPHGLWLDYSRLHVLETRAGNRSLAKLYLLKSQYWYIAKAEMNGEKPEETVSFIDTFNSEKCFSMVDRFDKANSADGKLPRYTEGIQFKD
jgi:hypothetical protein